MKVLKAIGFYTLVFIICIFIINMFDKGNLTTFEMLLSFGLLSIISTVRKLVNSYLAKQGGVK